MRHARSRPGAPILEIVIMLILSTALVLLLLIRPDRPTAIETPDPARPSPTNAPFPNPVEEDLLVTSVPEELWQHCDRDEDDQPSGVGAGIRCEVPGSHVVRYWWFDTNGPMEYAYERHVQRTEATFTRGRCPTERVAEEPYRVDGRHAGRLLCYHDPGGVPFLTWTDRRSGVCGVAEGTDADLRSLHGWWVQTVEPDPVAPPFV